MKNIEVKIKGMDCAECTQHVQAALIKVPHVQNAQVYLAAEKAVISYEQSMPDMSRIRQAVSHAGYEVLDDQPEPDAKPSVALPDRLFQLLAGVAMLVVLVSVLGEWLGLLDGLQQAVPWFIWTVIILAGGWKIFLKVLRAALDRRVISHTLMTLGVVAAAAVGAWPTAVVVVLFMRVGDFVESYSAGNARSAVRQLADLAPRTARVEKNGREQVVPINEVHIGDNVVVRPGEIIPVDGRVSSGSASVNQSSISGESMPLEALAGMDVFAASIVESGMLKVTTTAVGADTTFGNVIRLVEEAETNRADVQRAADVFAGYYLPLVLAVAALTIFLRRDPLAAAAVLVVACSCSFTLATPIAMLASIGSAAKQGLLIKGGKYIELLDRVDTIFLDKTGTLTLGKPAITDVRTFNDMDETELIRLTAAVERYSEHPLAGAVREKALQLDLAIPEVERFINIPGVGVRAELNGRQIAVVNDAEVPLGGDVHVIQQLREQGRALLFVQVDGQTVGVLAAADSLRADVRQALDGLISSGVARIVLLSGDHEAAVRQIAESLGISYQAAMLPQDKINMVIAAQNEGHVVAMIGDGVNDAPALAQADVGFAMGVTGSDISNQAAKISLLREDWMLIPRAFQIARRTMRVVRANILFTAVYNLVGLTMAALGFLPPVLAAALQSLPDLGILANSSRLIKTK